MHDNEQHTMHMKSKLSARVVWAVAFMLVLSGCDHLLDIEPQQQISDEIALSTPSAVETALVGAYEALANANLYGGDNQMLTDLLGYDGDVAWTGTFSQPRELHAKSILVDNSFVRDQWLISYRGINIANNVLSVLDIFEDAARRDRVAGEAEFIRGLLYFDLATRYGKAWNDGDPNTNLAVPITTEPTRQIGPEQNLPRETVAAVYQRAITDLTSARDKLPPSNGIFADTYAASAILARVYMSQGQWQSAAAEASRVIESGRFDLEDDFEDVFNRTTDIDEYVFAIQVTPQSAHSLNTFYGAPPNGRGDIDITQQHMDRYELIDERRAFFFIDGDGVRRTSKWRFGAAQGMNIPVVRLAEMYLTRAEANFRGGTTIGATPLADVNRIRVRAGLLPLLVLTLDDILRERRLELAFEGHRLFDAKRAQETLNTTPAIPWNHNRLVYPIPEREMDTNPELVQNPGYGG
jgi:starch-binding outer membrane protein, SusD/RagB family